MKLHKLISRITSSVLAVMLLATAMPMTAFASQQAELTYSFANDKAGFAEGKITLTLSDTADYGNYTLYWADDENVLSGYYPITTLTAVGGLASFSFLENIVIPPDATKLVAFAENSSDQTSVSSASFVYNVPQSKQNPNKSTDKTLSFEAISDTQLDMQSTVFYTYSQKHFALALEDAADRNVDFVTTSGDCINNYENGTSKEWQGFQKIIADSSYTNPIYETNGNHSMKSDINYGLEAYKAATGLGVDNEGLGDAPYYEITAKNGDHFIFVALEADDSPGTSDEFSTEQLDWLESTIEKYYDDGHRIFVFEHAFFHGWGPGDDKEQHYYSGGLRTTSEYPNNLRFKEILDTYNEVFCYTGHSHFDFMYNWNYDNENGEACNLFHIPATACTTHITNGKIDYSMDENSSQCYIVDCYDDMVISNGLNVVDNLIYPQYSYIVDTSGYTHEPNVKPTEGTTEPTTESSNMIDVQVNNTTSYLYSEGAAVFFYNNDSGNHFPVDSTTGIAQIPENATNLTLYRCNGSWNSGLETKSDSVTSFWNKFGPVQRAEGQLIFNVAGSSKYSWETGEIVYPSTEPTTEPQESTAPVTANESTIYWAIPKDFTDLGYTFRINLKTSAGTYPHSALVLTDTGETYNGLEVYSYTFSEAYTAEYDTAGIARIQLQAAESASTSAKMYAQYAFTDKTYTVSELNGKIFVSPDASPSGTKTATSSGWISYKQVEPDPTEATEPTTEATANESTIYWAIPKDFTDLGYTFRINLKTSAGTYPHSALVLTDTGETYNGLEVYSYTFSEAYTAEYDTAGIARIQLQAAESASTSAKMYAQYAFTDKTYTVSELNGKIFVSPDASPSGTKTATSSGWISYKGSVDDPTEPPTEATEPTTLPYEAVEIKVLDATSSGWVYTAGAVLYVYDKDTGNYYTVADEKAYIPKEAVNLTVYRCDGAWSVGNKNDGIASYWNKWDLSTRADGFDIINLGGSDTFTWLSSASYKPEVDVKYYLLGYFNGADYESRDYKFDENGSLEMKFLDDSYVYVVSSSNTSYYTNGWLGYDSTSAVLYRSTSLSNPDKFYVPAGIATFTLVSNEDGSLTLSYELEPNELDKTEIEPIYEDMQIGDVNNDGKISVKDATMIQKYIGEAITFTSEMFYCADVYGNGTVNVRSATLIQKRAADSFDLFPAEEGYKADVRDLGSLLTVAGETLYTDYRYASFVAYSKLKTQYYAYKDVDLEALSKSETEEAYANLYAAYANFNEMKENNTISTVYFCNDIGWSNVKAYCYNSSTGKYINAFDNAQGISKVKILKSGVKILEITLNQEKWDKIIFTNGDGSQTVSLDVPKQNCIGYYFTDCQTDEKGRLIPNKFRYTYDRISAS